MRPVLKLYYNRTITLASVVVVVLIGGIEAFVLPADQLSLKGGLWGLIGTLNENFNERPFIAQT